jgi:hypothetical protein
MGGDDINNTSCIDTGGKLGLSGGWFVDNGDRVIWRRINGRTINVWDKYVNMLGSIRQFLFDGIFVNTERYNRTNRKSDKHKDIRYGVNKYLREVYGCGFDRTYNEVHGRKIGTRVTHNNIYDALIHYYGIDTMDWSYLFMGVDCFSTNNDQILECIAKSALYKSRLYDYFIGRYNLRFGGVVIDTRRKDSYNRKVIRLDWDGGSRLCDLSELMYNKRYAWIYMTSGSDRSDIRNYDVLMSGSSESVVLPDRCPIFNNIVLNYTGIDFSQKKKNKKRCSEGVYDGSKEDVWSAASIDRIDSSKGYSYDNIKIISEYANSLKNCHSEYYFECMLQYFRNNRAVI